MPEIPAPTIRTSKSVRKLSSGWGGVGVVMRRSPGSGGEHDPRERAGPRQALRRFVLLRAPRVARHRAAPRRSIARFLTRVRDGAHRTSIQAHGGPPRALEIS